MRLPYPILRHPFTTHLILIGLVLAVLAGAAISLDDHLAVARMEKDLEARGRIAQSEVIALVKAGDHKRLQTFCTAIASDTATRVTIILPDGTILADSHEKPADMENHRDRPEVIAALAGRVGASHRHSYTLNTEMFYVALPLNDGTRLLGVLRTALPAAALAHWQRAQQHGIIVVAMVLFAVAATIAWFLHRDQELTLKAMRQWATDLATGTPSRKSMSLTGPDSILALAAALDHLVGQLTERIALVSQERNELEAVFGSMVEGVLTVDAEERVQSFNPAALALLGLDPRRVKGRPTLEAVRNLDLQRFIKATLAAATRQEREIALPDAKGDSRSFYLCGVPLKEGEGQRVTGALVVMSDVTNLRRLETVRRDFVANVSHELKTPITSIAGFVETLLDGALTEPDNARRFLNIIHQQAKRLHAIVEDLLALSRLEKETERHEITLDHHPIREAIAGAVQTCLPAATAKKISIRQECPPTLAAWLNPPLFEQALVNLIDNAIKYSPPDSDVLVFATATDDEVVVTVEDQGVGIAPRDQSRVFERFFRVDKARSSGTGGTGLGLAIVKHIVQAHGGRVTLTSTPGKGSTFAIHLRQAPTTTPA